MEDKYNWKGMHQQIERSTQQCITCLKAGSARHNTKNRIIETKHPNELWECDLIGRIPVGRERNVFIFVAIDHYTKWIETRIILNKTAEEIKNAIEECIIKKHGIPKRILTDFGLGFKNKETEGLAEKYLFQWEFSSPHHHNTVGAVERVNQTLMNKLKKLTEFGEKDWIPLLQAATEATNISFQRAIGTSPYVLKYGKNPILAIDEITGIQPKQKNLISLRAKRDDNWKRYVKNNIQKGKVEIKNNLRIGDPVLVFREPLKNKFAEAWFPGYKIIKEISPDGFEIQKGSSRIRANKKHLKKDTTKKIGEGDVVIPELFDNLVPSLSEKF